ncbi:MAG TPA: HepT-like ribonuclease domain-containing protein [Thermoanaerobaculia bacterium]
MRDRGLLYDILKSARLIVQYVEGITREVFDSDTKTQDAVIRRIEIIGEAANEVWTAVMTDVPALIVAVEGFLLA